MIKAWVAYYNGRVYKFEELDGTDFNSVQPEDWGLSSSCSILLVLHHAQFQQAWLHGVPVKKW